MYSEVYLGREFFRLQEWAKASQTATQVEQEACLQPCEGLRPLNLTVRTLYLYSDCTDNAPSSPLLSALWQCNIQTEEKKDTSPSPWIGDKYSQTIPLLQLVATICRCVLRLYTKRWTTQCSLSIFLCPCHARCLCSWTKYLCSRITL
jgi:hypothetical protein